jgi:hypothetical protein
MGFYVHCSGTSVSEKGWDFLVELRECKVVDHGAERIPV